MRNAAILLAAVVLACGGDSTGDPTGPPAATLSVVLEGGDAQAAAVDTRLPNPVSVGVMRAGSPAPGTVVSFVVTSEGGGRAFAGTAAANADGVATDLWELGTKAGEHTMEVRTVDADGTPRVWGSFTATALPGPAAALEYDMPDTTLYLAGGSAQMDVGVYGSRAWDEHGNEITDRQANYDVEGPLSVDGTTLTATDEGTARFIASLEAARDTARVSAVHDLRTLGAATLELLCIHGQTVEFGGGGAVWHDSVRATVELAWADGPPAYSNTTGTGTAVVWLEGGGTASDWEPKLDSFSPRLQEPGEIHFGDATTLALVSETETELVYQAAAAADVGPEDPCHALDLVPAGYPNGDTEHFGGRGTITLTIDST